MVTNSDTGRRFRTPLSGRRWLGRYYHICIRFCRISIDILFNRVYLSPTSEPMTREFVILPQFERLWKNLGLGDDDMRPLEEFLCLHPDQGNVVVGTGGLRKLRWGLGSSGKRGGIRILYADFPAYEKLYLLAVYKKTVKVDLSKNEAVEIRKLIGELKKELKRNDG